MKFPTGGKVREPKGRACVIQAPTVKSGWKKKFYARSSLVFYCPEICFSGFFSWGHIF